MKYFAGGAFVLLSCLGSESKTITALQPASPSVREASAILADTLSTRAINPLDTCDFSDGDWVFYVVEDTSLTQVRYITDTYGSPSLILDNEQVMQAMKSKWSMVCPGADATTCFAYLTVLRNGTKVWFSSLCISSTEEVVQNQINGMCLFQEKGALHEILSSFRPIGVFPAVPQKPVRIEEIYPR